MISPNLPTALLLLVFSAADKLSGNRVIVPILARFVLIVGAVLFVTPVALRGTVQFVDTAAYIVTTVVVGILGLIMIAGPLLRAGKKP